eukprot:gnl/TRDRNA2_/TRDRNA2_146938_c0_seq1.p1 gnl/TRDRNA2_/TRDRNA2_146938_c0~~gnl/TRDRNA2_/TRDRNA2_146938_c0_seq1.p1  ORF type:complete len:351 (+),score=55.15 gnl/TRDRNA2_/TRDRNA2_146938_c0_seq1:168-1220(+)
MGKRKHVSQLDCDARTAANAELLQRHAAGEVLTPMEQQRVAKLRERRDKKSRKAENKQDQPAQFKRLEPLAMQVLLMIAEHAAPAVQEVLDYMYPTQPRDVHSRIQQLSSRGLLTKEDGLLQCTEAAWNIFRKVGRGTEGQFSKVATTSRLSPKDVRSILLRVGHLVNAEVAGSSRSAMQRTTQRQEAATWATVGGDTGDDHATACVYHEEEDEEQDEDDEVETGAASEVEYGDETRHCDEDFATDPLLGEDGEQSGEDERAVPHAGYGLPRTLQSLRPRYSPPPPLEPPPNRAVHSIRWAESPHPPLKPSLHTPRPSQKIGCSLGDHVIAHSTRLPAQVPRPSKKPGLR